MKLVPINCIGRKEEKIWTNDLNKGMGLFFIVNGISCGVVLAHAAFTHTALVVLLYWTHLKGFINTGLVELNIGFKS